VGTKGAGDLAGGLASRLIPGGTAGMVVPMTCSAEQVIAMLRDEGLVELPGDAGPDTDLFGAGLDSMAVMQLIVVIEERFGVALGAADASRESLGTPARLAATVSARK